MASEEEKQTARQARLVAIVITVTTVLWLGGQWLGRQLGLPERYALLFDLIALAGFIFAMAVTYRIWRQRRNN